MDRYSAIKNRNVSQEGRLHAEQELQRIQSNESTPSDDEARHQRNVARGLKAYVSPVPSWETGVSLFFLDGGL